MTVVNPAKQEPLDLHEVEIDEVSGAQGYWVCRGLPVVQVYSISILAVVAGTLLCCLSADDGAVVGLIC